MIMMMMMWRNRNWCHYSEKTVKKCKTEWYCFIGESECLMLVVLFAFLFLIVWLFVCWCDSVCVHSENRIGWFSPERFNNRKKFPFFFRNSASNKNLIDRKPFLSDENHWFNLADHHHHCIQFIRETKEKPNAKPPNNDNDNQMYRNPTNNIQQKKSSGWKVGNRFYILVFHPPIEIDWNYFWKHWAL